MADVRIRESTLKELKKTQKNICTEFEKNSLTNFRIDFKSHELEYLLQLLKIHTEKESISMPESILILNIVKKIKNIPFSIKKYNALDKARDEKTKRTKKKLLEATERMIARGEEVKVTALAKEAGVAFATAKKWLTIGEDDEK